MDLLERLRHDIRIERREAAPFKVERKVEVADDGGHVTAQERHILVVDHLLFLLAFELVHMLVDAFKVPVCLQQLCSRLVADTRHAGNVVGRVAFEAEEIDELVGAHAVALLHLRGPVHGHVGDALLRGDDAGLAAGQLIGVLVARDEERFVA